MIESISLKCTCGKIRKFKKSEFAKAMLERYECGCENTVDLYPNQRIIWLSDQINEMYRYLSEAEGLKPIAVNLDRNIPVSKYLAFVSFYFRHKDYKKVMHAFLGGGYLPPQNEGETLLVYRDETFEPAYPDPEIPELGPNYINLLMLLRFWNQESDQMPYLSNYRVYAIVPELQQLDEH